MEEINDISNVYDETMEAITKAGKPADIEPVDAKELAQAMSKYMNDKYVQGIHGKQYPKVEWWNRLGAMLNVKPLVEDVHRVEETQTDEEIKYIASVVLRSIDGRNILHGRGLALCSNLEKMWRNQDEYAIMSMAETRAVGKAYRVGYSHVAIEAGLQPTPAEEVFGTEDTFDAKPQAKKYTPKEQLKPIASDSATLPDTEFNFGKHKGTAMKQTPLSYIHYVAEHPDFSMPDWKQACKEYLDLTKQVQKDANETMLTAEQNKSAWRTVLKDKLGNDFDQELRDYSVVQLEKIISTFGE